MRKSIFISFIILTLISVYVSGQTWSPIKRLTWNSGWSENPTIAIGPSNLIHVAWWDSTPPGFEILYKQSTDGGTTWSAVKRLSWNTGRSLNPSIATDPGNRIHIVWYDEAPGNWEIFYKQSTDGGTNWSSLKRLTWNTGSSRSPTIAADQGNGIHVVWDDNTPGNTEIFYKKSTNNGTNWSGPIRLTWTTGASCSPSIATDSSGGIHVAWHDNLAGNQEIFYKRSTDGGITWSGITRLTWNTGDSWTTSIAVSPIVGIHVVWNDITPNNWEIFYKRSTDGGITWSGPTRITRTTHASLRPSISADLSGDLHVVWDEWISGYTYIIYKRSPDSGGTWNAPTRLTWGSSSSKNPSLATNQTQGIHVTWDNTEVVRGKEIFYKNYKPIKTK